MALGLFGVWANEHTAAPKRTTDRTLICRWNTLTRSRIPKVFLRGRADLELRFEKETYYLQQVIFVRRCNDLLNVGMRFNLPGWVALQGRNPQPVCAISRCQNKWRSQPI